MKSVDEFEGIVVQTDAKLNITFSNKTYKALSLSEQSELMKTCAEVLSEKTPQRIQRTLSNQFFVFMCVPKFDETGTALGIALTGFPLSFKVFKDVVLDHMSDLVFYISILNDQFYLRGINSRFLEVTGLKEEDIIGKNVLDIIPVEDQEKFLTKYRLAIKERVPQKWEDCTNFPKGITYGEIILIPICTDLECHSLIGIVRDVTERKLTEIEFAKNYSILNELVESTSDFIFIKDLSGKYLLVNSAAAKLLGKSKFDFIGKKDVSLFSEATANTFVTNDRHTIESGVMQHFDEECTINNKHYFFHSAKGPFRNDKGEIAGTLGISRDITEKIMAERKLAHSYSMLVATLNATADGILVIDQHKVITNYNQRFLDLWQIPEELLIRNAYDEVLHGVLDQLRNPDECLARLKQLDLDPCLQSYDLLFFKDGRMLERYTIPQVLDGKVVGRVFSYRDLSKREDARVKLQSC